MSDNDQRIFIVPFGESSYELLVYGTSRNEVSTFLQQLESIELAVSEIVFDAGVPPTWRPIPPLQPDEWRTAVLSEEMLSALQQQPNLTAEQIIRVQFPNVELESVYPFVSPSQPSPWDEWTRDSEINRIIRELNEQPEFFSRLEASQANIVDPHIVGFAPELASFSPPVSDLMTELERRIAEIGVVATSDVPAFEFDANSDVIATSDLHVEIRQDESAAALTGDLRLTVHLEPGEPSGSSETAFAFAMTALDLSPVVPIRTTRTQHSYQLNAFKSLGIKYRPNPGPVDLALWVDEQPLLQLNLSSDHGWTRCVKSSHSPASWFWTMTGQPGTTKYDIIVNGYRSHQEFD